MLDKWMPRKFVFSYRLEGKDYGITIPAKDMAEAHERIKAISTARYDGELWMSVPLPFVAIVVLLVAVLLLSV